MTLRVARQINVFALYVDNLIYYIQNIMNFYKYKQYPHRGSHSKSSISSYWQIILQNFKSVFSMKYGSIVFFN